MPLERATIRSCAQPPSRRFQFTIRDLLVAALAVAATLGLARSLGWEAIAIPVSCGMVICFAPRSPGSGRTSFILCVTLLGTCLFGHLLAASLAWETVGEGESFLYYLFLLLFYWLPYALCAARALWPAAIVGLLFFTLCVPIQIVLSIRLALLREEVTRIVDYVDHTWAATGAYPTDLSGYTPHRPALMGRIAFYCDDQFFEVRFWSDSRNVAHWYSSGSGWGYYPD